MTVTLNFLPTLDDPNPGFPFTLTIYNAQLKITTQSNLGSAPANNASLSVKPKTINIKNLPTTAVGLVSGDLWNNGGVLTIV